MDPARGARFLLPELAALDGDGLLWPDPVGWFERSGAPAVACDTPNFGRKAVIFSGCDDSHRAGQKAHAGAAATLVKLPGVKLPG